MRGRGKPNRKHQGNYLGRMWTQQMFNEIEPHLCYLRVGGDMHVCVHVYACVYLCVGCRTLSTLLYHHLPHSPKTGDLAKPEVGSFILVRLADLQTLEIAMSPVLRLQWHTALLDFLCKCWDLNLGFHPYATRAVSPRAISIFPHAFEKRICLFVCLLACLTIMIIHLKFPVYLEET